MINVLTKENSSRQNNKTKKQNNNINKTTINTCWATGSKMPAIVRVWYSGILRPLSLPGLCKFSQKFSQRFREEKDWYRMCWGISNSWSTHKFSEKNPLNSSSAVMYRLEIGWRLLKQHSCNSLISTQAEPKYEPSVFALERLHTLPVSEYFAITALEVKRTGNVSYFISGVCKL